MLNFKNKSSITMYQLNGKEINKYTVIGILHGNENTTFVYYVIIICDYK